MRRWDYKWWDSIQENWISPYKNNENNIRFTYWWDDMLPKEIEELVKEAYTCGYERGRKELEPEIDRLREGVECHVAHPGEGTYECNINKPCPACKLRDSEEKTKKSYERGVKDFIDWYKDKFPKCDCEELEFRSKSFLIEKNPEEWLENWISFFEFDEKRRMILNSLEIKIKEAKDEGDPIPTEDTINLLEATLKLFSPNIKKDNLIGLFLTDSGAINLVLQNAEERIEFIIDSPNINLKFV